MFLLPPAAHDQISHPSVCSKHFAAVQSQNTESTLSELHLLIGFINSDLIVPRNVEFLCLGCGDIYSIDVGNSELGVKGVWAYLGNAIYSQNVQAFYTSKSCHGGKQSIEPPGGHPSSAVKEGLIDHVNESTISSDKNIEHFVEVTKNVALERWRA